MNDRKKIFISLNGNFYTDQRLLKVVKTLENEFEICLFSKSIENLSRNNHNKIIEYRPYFLSGFFSIVEFNLRVFIFLLCKTNKESILLSNDLDTLLPNYLLKLLKNNKLVFDSHEIFSELPYIRNNFVKNVWKFLEKNLIPKVDKFYTVSESYAVWFEENYHKKAEVISNFPLQSDYLNVGKTSYILPEKFILYQGYVSEFRGLEKAMFAMEFVENCKLVIIGNGPILQNLVELKENLTWKEKIIFIEKLLPEELRKITHLAEMGLSIEDLHSESFKRTLPNKIFDYIQAEVPVVCSNFNDISSVFQQFNIGEIIENNDPKTLANAINNLLLKGKKFYSDDLQKAKKIYNWENQEDKLLEIFNFEKWKPNLHNEK